MNKSRLTAMCHTISDNTGLTFNAVLIHFFLESILRRIAGSDYRDYFVFKGGFLLSNVVGMRARSTVDIDMLLRHATLTEPQLRRMFSEILSPSPGEVVTYEVQSIQPIRQADRYGGLRVQVMCRLENIRQRVPLDIATGDVITPQEVAHRFVSVFDGEGFMVNAYPIETMLAEKLHTMYALGFFNSRSKDYYDVHVLYRLKANAINHLLLYQACEKTFRQRDTVLDLGAIEAMLEQIRADQAFVKRWQNYGRKNAYAQGLSFQEVVDSALELLLQMNAATDGLPG